MPTSPSALCEVLRGSPDSLGAAAHLIVEYCMQMLAAVRVGDVYRTPPSSSFQLLIESKRSMLHGSPCSRQSRRVFSEGVLKVCIPCMMSSACTCLCQGATRVP